MLAQTWPPISYWLTADDRMIATAVEILNARDPDEDEDE